MFRFFFILLGIGGASWFLMHNLSVREFFGHERVWVSDDSEKSVRVIFDDDGNEFEVETQSRTVKDFLNQQNIIINDGDMVFFQLDDRLFDGKKLKVLRIKHVTLVAGGEKKQVDTYQTEIQKAFIENSIIPGEDDIFLPKGEGVVKDGSSTTLIRVVIKEETVNKSIPFETTIEEDTKLSWRKTIVNQKGENGIKHLVYKISLHDGEEVDRKLISQEIAKDPVTEKVTQGTYVETGKAHTGLGTWYAFTGTMAAASPWLPMGSYAKVTNKGNGKTVIVKINDRGPFGTNRIIDLDKVAFAKIASLGAGVIDVKVEEITN